MIDSQNFPKALTDRFEVLDLLGAGGMGNVYRAKDKQLPREVALKEVKKEFIDDEDIRKRIERESQLHAKIGSHQNIVTLYDVIKTDQSLYLVLEYVEGETLASIVKENASKGVRLSETKVVDIILQLLKALQRIHLHDVVHRDLKPENLLIGQDDDGEWLVKLMDFGIAKASDNVDNETNLTQIGTGGPGTPSYMAPEQIDASTYGEISDKTDVYAAGVIFYELMTGIPPFTGTLTEVYSGHLMKDVGSLATTEKMTEQWKSVICKALEKKPSDRFDGVSQMSESIAKIILTQGSDPDPNKTLLVNNADLNKTQVLRSHDNSTKVVKNDALADLLTSSREESIDANKTQLMSDADTLEAVLTQSVHNTSREGKISEKGFSILTTIFQKVKENPSNFKVPLIVAGGLIALVLMVPVLLDKEGEISSRKLANQNDNPAMSPMQTGTNSDSTDSLSSQKTDANEAFKLARQRALQETDSESSTSASPPAPIIPKQNNTPVKTAVAKEPAKPKPKSSSRFGVGKTQSKKIN